jgi:NADP-dependent 3-hydroxy acid dehydrogenase YdfG
MLDGKVALITGGSRGQGRAHAVTCAREGADVIIVDIAGQLATVPYQMARQDDLDETAKQVEALDRRILAIKGDVRDQAQLDAAVAQGFAEFGQIDILIANAGIWTQAPFWELTDDQWDEMIGVNLTGVWKSAKAVAPHMIERRSGSIVITSSTNGIEPGLNYAHYVAAKHGVIGLMKNIALELAPVRDPLQLDQPGRDPHPDDRPPGCLGHVRRAPGRHRGRPDRGRLPLHRPQGHHVHGPAGHRGHSAVPELGPGRQGHRGDDPRRRRTPDLDRGQQHASEITGLG